MTVGYGPFVARFHTFRYDFSTFLQCPDRQCNDAIIDAREASIDAASQCVVNLGMNRHVPIERILLHGNHE